MGNSQSSADPRLVSATRAFSQKELEDLESLFLSLASQSHSNGEYVSPSVFQGYFGLRSPLAERMFHLITQKRNDQKLTFEDLVIAKGTYEKGTNEEIEKFLYQLLDVTGDGIIERSDVKAVLAAVFEDLFPSNSPELVNSDKDPVCLFLDAASFSKQHEEDAENSMTFEDFRRWCNLAPSIKKFLGSLLMPPEQERLGTQVPRLLHSEGLDCNVMLLKREHAWFLGGVLPQPELEEWTLLYQSTSNGLSFNTFLGSIANHEGPTVLIIKDKEGYIYGGYASQPWEKHSDFYGDMKSFLFQLYPEVSIFRATGANKNLQWCGVNFSSESMPNGIGFGGRIDHFGLFLSASFDQGQTFSCTTFGSPCLSKTARIHPDIIECWGTFQNKEQREVHDAVKGNVLERFKEDRHMLNMVGLADSSH